MVNVFTRPAFVRAAIAVMRLESIPPVGGHLPFHRIAEQGLELVDQLLGRGRGRGRGRQSPVGLAATGIRPQVIDQEVPLRQLPDTAQDAALSRHVAVGEIAIERLGIELSRERGIGQEGLQLGGKVQPTVHMRVEQRLLTRAVARQDQLPSGRVVEAEREHPV